MKTPKELEQYYTKEDTVGETFSIFEEKVLKKVSYNLIIEPSAGSGAFLNVLEKNGWNYKAFDIDPKDSRITEADFLNDKIDFNEEEYEVAVIGNPPFGKKSKLAIQFLNESFAKGALTVGFIVPIQFQKWGVHRKIISDARLIFNKKLKENSFTLDGKTISLRTVFQIWTIDYRLNDNDDLRIKTRPETTHSDFEMWQYNRTKQAEKFFDYDWDFAVVRQGFYNYNEKIYSKEKCNRKRQYIFFKAFDKKTLEKLKKINFQKLSEKNTTINGFGKADVIQEYRRLYE